MNKESDHTYMGIKFYSNSDLSLPMNIKAALEFIKECKNLDFYTEINTILELYNIKKIFHSMISAKTCGPDELDLIKKKNKEINARLSSFAKDITDSNIGGLFENTSVCYRDDFFGYIDHFKAYKHISHEAFSKLLEQNINAVFLVLRHKKIVDYYDETIAEYIRMHPVEIAEVVLRVYLTKDTAEEHTNSAIFHVLRRKKIVDYYDDTIKEYICKHPVEIAEVVLRVHITKDMKKGHTTYFLPKSLEATNKRDIIHEYINSSEANPNYLKLIASSGDDKSILLDVETRFAAKKAFELWMRQIFSQDTGFPIGAEVSFEYIDEDIHIDKSGELSRYTYNRKWIEDNLDYPTLLQNFVTLFEFADYQSRILLVSFDAEIGALEKHIGVKGKNDYPYGVQFVFKNILSTVQMQVYRAVLLNYGIQIEEVFEWFFENYIPEEFNIEGFSFTAPTPESSYREKSRDILAELDGVLKQYQLYSKSGKIDRELFEMISGSLPFDQIKSLQKEKYGYNTSDELRGILELLFSDQSIIAFNKKTQSQYSTFAEALLKDSMCSDDFEFYQSTQLERLLDKGIIHKAESGVLYIDSFKFPILSDLYYRETLCLPYVEDFPYVKELKMTGALEIESTLFSRSEQKYLDYMLNHHRYSNSKDLRNRYMHGNNTQTKEQQFCDYIEILKVVAIVIIKINQELCNIDKQ